MATQGIDVRQSTGRLIFRVLLLDGSGTVVTTGTTNLRIYELQDDGTLKSYDFNDNTFKTTALTTEHQTMTHRTGNNGTRNTGLWTSTLTTLTGFTAGTIYLVEVENSNASPAIQAREFQFGNAEGDLTVTSARMNVNVEAINNDAAVDGRLAAALTTSSGIDINMGQSTPGSPSADTTGEALRAAHQSIPLNAAAGGNGGLPTVDANNRIAGIQGSLNTLDDIGTLRLVKTTMQTSSTTLQLIANASDLPTDTDDIYNNLVVVAFDSSAGNKPNVRLVSDYDSATNKFTLNTDLDFTPEIGVDTFEVWATSDTSLTGELLKVTTGFSSASPNNLRSYLKAMMDKLATVPTGLNTFDPSTDSIEAIRDLLDLCAGSGFSTGTDSLKAIRDAIDQLIAPAVASSTSLSGSGFLSDCVTLIRQITDEPSSTPKYTDADLVEYIHSAFDVILADLNVNSDHPILVRTTISVTVGQQDYLLPPNVGEVWRLAKIDSTTNLPLWDVWPTTEFNFYGGGFTVEGNVLRLRQKPTQADTLEVLFVPNGEPAIHKGTATSGTSSTIVLASTPTDGSLDARPAAYAGYVVRILSGTGAGQERILSAYDESTRTGTVRPDWSVAPDATSVYEVVPQFSRLLKHVVCLQAASDILSNEANHKRLSGVTQRLQVKMRALRLFVAKKNSRFAKRFEGDTDDNENRYPYWGY